MSPGHRPLPASDSGSLRSAGDRAGNDCTAAEFTYRLQVSHDALASLLASLPTPYPGDQHRGLFSLSHINFSASTLSLEGFFLFQAALGAHT